ncbi:tripartite tricarboxylate transporter substrate-binding protein [Mesobacillus foraminis]|uniref:tripartite tricarboxylate transporter substrate binding protein n=1 Tax=Mesobacillus foraminis TaxID=279826 RepID=UPI00399FE64F
MKRKLLFLLFLMISVFMGCSVEEKPNVASEDVQIVAPSPAGGGWDRTARAIKDILISQELVNGNISIVNKIGAGGELGWKSINQEREGQALAVNSSLLITNQLLGRSQLTVKDFTPLATLATEWEVVLVSKDADISSARALMDHLKKAPHNYRFGVSPRLGNDDQLSFVLAGRQAGIEAEQLDYYVYEDSDQVVKALLSHQVDVAAMSLSEAKKYYDSKQVKLLVVSSHQRVSEIPEVPTWKEEGIDLVFQHWRGVMGPAGMTEEEIQFWDETFAQMVSTKEWKQTLKKYMWKDFYKNSKETKKYLEEQSRMYEELLGGSGQ